MQAVREPFDVVLTTNSGFPLDQNLYQEVKGMSAAAQVARPGGAIVIVSGDVSVERGQELARKLVAGWEKSEPAEVKIELPEAAKQRRIVLVDRPEGKQATVRIGMRPRPPEFEDFRPGDIRHSLADIGKARRSLGYAPTHDLEAGLTHTVAWYVDSIADDALRPGRQAAT